MARETLLAGFDAVLADLDGVVYAGPHAIPGAIEALSGLAGAGVKLGYVTNNASRTPAHVAAHLRELGAPADDDQVVSSAQAGAALLAGKFPRGSRVLVVGSKALAQEVEAVGMAVVGSAKDAPDVVIQGFDPHLGWHDLAEAAFAIHGGAAWIATNTDMTIPRERGIAPGNGSLVAAVRAAVGTDPLVAGKPEAPLFHEAARRLGAATPLVVGDRLDTDILGGNNAGMATALVLTGVDSLATALRARTSERPRFIIDTLAGLYEPYPPVTRDGAAFSCDGASAIVEGGTLTLTLSGSGHDGGRPEVGGHDGGRPEAGEHDGGVPERGISLSAGRALCAAWWAARPDADAATEPDVVIRHGGAQ